MEKYIGTYHKSSPFIQNLLKKQICSFAILWQNYPPMEIFSQICHSADLLKSACRNSPPPIWRFSQICHSADLLKSACRNSPKELWVIQP